MEQARRLLAVKRCTCRPVSARRAMGWRMGVNGSVREPRDMTKGVLSTSDNGYSVNFVVVTAYYSAQDPIIQEGVQAWVDFQCETTRCDVIVEMIEGLTVQMRPETALLRRRLRRPMP